MVIKPSLVPEAGHLFSLIVIFLSTRFYGEHLRCLKCRAADASQGTFVQGHQAPKVLSLQKGCGPARLNHSLHAQEALRENTVPATMNALLGKRRLQAPTSSKGQEVVGMVIWTLCSFPTYSHSKKKKEQSSKRKNTRQAM